jgi:hypothetical protein
LRGLGFPGGWRDGGETEDGGGVVLRPLPRRQDRRGNPSCGGWLLLGSWPGVSGATASRRERREGHRGWRRQIPGALAGTVREVILAAGFLRCRLRQPPGEGCDVKDLPVHVRVVFEAEYPVTGDGEVDYAAGLLGLRQRDHRAAGAGAGG